MASNKKNVPGGEWDAVADDVPADLDAEEVLGNIALQ